MNSGTRFRIMRRWLLLSAAVVPLALAVALISFVGGYPTVAGGSVLLAAMLYLVFPFDSIANPFPASLRRTLPEWISRVATVFFVLWLVQFPELAPFVERVFSGGPLWDWRLLLAVALWTARIMWLNSWKVAGFSDAQIYQYYSGKSS